jgi:branched-chain amino acid transport system substrate-binding protein
MKGKIALGLAFTMLLFGSLFFALPIEAQNEVTIGIIGPQGLPHWSPAGMKDAAEMARDEINLAGGIDIGGTPHDIVLAFGNEFAVPTPDPVQAYSEAERLITVEGCEILVGGFRTEVTAAIIEAAADYATPLLINGAATNELISDTVPVDYARYKYLFRLNPVNGTALLYTIAGGIGGYLLNPTAPIPGAGYMIPIFADPTLIGPYGPGQVAVAVITEDLDWTLGIHGALTTPSVYPALLGPFANVTYSGRIPDGTTDCTPWLTDVIASNARILIHIFSGTTGVPFVAQWRALSVNATLCGINVMAQLQTHWATTGGACEYETMLNFAGTRTPIVPTVTRAFWDSFVARTGVWPIYTAWGAYDAIYALKEAMEDIDSKDKDALVAYFESPSYQRQGLSGLFKYTSIHDVFTDEFGPVWFFGNVRALLAQWTDERMEIVCPKLQTYSKTWALPPWMYPLIQDTNYDQFVGIDDIVFSAEHFGDDPTRDRWEHVCDTTKDDYIGIDDIVDIASHFGDSP